MNKDLIGYRTLCAKWLECLRQDYVPVPAGKTYKQAVRLLLQQEVISRTEVRTYLIRLLQQRKIVSARPDTVWFSKQRLNNACDWLDTITHTGLETVMDLSFYHYDHDSMREEDSFLLYLLIDLWNYRKDSWLKLCAISLVHNECLYGDQSADEWDDEFCS